MLRSILVDYNPVAQVALKIAERWGLAADIFDYLRSLLFNKNDSALEKILFLLGAAALTFKVGSSICKTASLWKWLPKHKANQKKFVPAKLKEKYGDCYVAITGFTDGIGRAFAEIFAEMGFNLLLIGRNKGRVESKVKELANIYPHIKIEYMVSDLSNLQDLNQIENQFNRFGDLDIGILVNNAGTTNYGSYLESKPQVLKSDLVVDILAVIMVNRILIPRLRERPLHSAILNITSCTGVYLASEIGVYSSSKKSIDIYSQILAEENNDKIDVVSVRPFGVATKLMRMKKGPFMITPRQCVMGTLVDLLGGEVATFGHIRHKLSSTLGFAPFNEEYNFGTFKKLWAVVDASAPQKK